MNGMNGNACVRLDGVILRRTDRGNGGFTLTVPSLCIGDDPAERCIPIMGLSGGGKTTLLNLLSGVQWPDEGSIRWDIPRGTADPVACGWGRGGVDGRTAAALRRNLGYMFQAGMLLSHLTVEENLVYPCRTWGVPKAAAVERMKDLLGKLMPDEQELHTRYPSQLSLGQRGRLALVQVLMHEPHVLVADEPTGNLDFDTRLAIMNRLFAWARETPGRLFLWVTHHEDDPALGGVNRRLFVRYDKARGQADCVWQRRTITGGGRQPWKREEWVDGL